VARDHAVAHGLFDLHWFDRCPLLEPVRGLPAGDGKALSDTLIG
jgi:hypothetical protein